MTKAIIKNITGTVITTPRIITNGLLRPHLSFRLKESAKNRFGNVETNDYLVNVYGHELRFSRLRSLPVGTLLRLTFITADKMSVVQFAPLTEEKERYTERHQTDDVKITLRKPRRYPAAA